MKIILLLSSLFLISNGTINAAANDSLEILKDKFNSFEHVEVIKMSNSLLKNKDNFSSSELIEIYRMKGISHYTLAEDEAAKRSFREILQIDPAFELNPSVTSPKIITFFNELKISYEEEIKQEPLVLIKVDTVYVPQEVPMVVGIENYRSSISKSLILPGWGHLASNEKTKGVILTGLSSLSAASFLYFLFDTNKKEKDYLNEKNGERILQKYDEYNFSYKMRNISIITFAVTWIYSQIDLLFFTNYRPSFGIENEKVSFSVTISL
jgi:tetratricopeptide (TPR) repeat protein